MVLVVNITPVMYIDPSGEAWWHWGLAVVGVGILIGVSIATFGAAAVFSGVILAAQGLASCSMGLTVASFAIVGSSLALAGSVIYAGLSSSNLDEFADYGGGALITTITMGAFGAFGGYASYNQQISKEPDSWTSKQQGYWKSQGYDSTPIGGDGHKMQLHHPYGRYGAKEDIFYPVTYTEHRAIHQELGNGRGYGGFNRYYDFDNVWKFFYEMFR